MSDFPSSPSRSYDYEGNDTTIINSTIVSDTTDNLTAVNSSPNSPLKEEDAAHTFPPSTATALSYSPQTPMTLLETSTGRRPSIHSNYPQSIQPDSTVFGTPPVGVIGKHKPREIVRVERDYSVGELCQFWSGWIWELEGRVSPTDFQNTMNELNAVLASAHDPYKSIFDNVLAILTLYLSPMILGSHYEREMKKFDKILERTNREVFNPVGLNFLPPRKNAFLFLEIEYY